MRRERMSRFYSQFVLSRPQGSARIAKPLMHECSKELNKLRKEKDSMWWLLQQSKKISCFSFSRPQGSARIAKPLEHECFKMRRTKQTLCVQTEVEGKHRCSSKPVARAKDKGYEVKTGRSQLSA